MINLTILPWQNTYISEEKPDTNFSYSDKLCVGMDSKQNAFRSLLSFDLSRLPLNVNLIFCYLKMYCCHIAKNSPLLILPYAVTSGWDEKMVTWNNQPQSSPSFVGKCVEVISYGWYSWDITTIARLWAADARSCFSVLLKSPESKTGNMKYFDSTRSIYLKHLPFLDIQYTIHQEADKFCRKLANFYETLITEDRIKYSTAQNTSEFSLYTFFVQNAGVNPASVFVQVSPDKKVVYNEGFVYNILPGKTEAIVPVKYGFYTRLAFKSFFWGKSTELRLWFQAKT